MGAPTNTAPAAADAATLSRLHALLGVAGLVRSHDDPLDRRRPSGAAMETLTGVAAIMGAIIGHAQVAAEAAHHRAAVEHLLRVSSQLAAARSRGDMLGA